MREFAEEVWWPLAASHGIADKTAEDIGWRAGHLLPVLGNVRLDRIDPQTVDALKVSKLEQGLSPSSWNKLVSLLQRILGLAVEYGLVETNPAHGRSRRARTQTPPRIYLNTAAQVSALLTAAAVLDHRANTHRGIRRALLATLALGGLRIGELLALKWPDVDLANGRLTVRGTKTSAAHREIRMFPALREALTEWRAASAGDGLVFATSTGGAWQASNIRRRILMPALHLARESGTPMPELTPHGLRRTYASMCAALQVPWPDLMASLGHTSAALTAEVYAKQ